MVMLTLVLVICYLVCCFRFTVWVLVFALRVLVVVGYCGLSCDLL